jgi:hypothetical protein
MQRNVRKFTWDAAYGLPPTNATQGTEDNKRLSTRMEELDPTQTILNLQPISEFGLLKWLLDVIQINQT